MRPYISLMQIPKKLPDRLLKQQITMDTIKDNISDGILAFKKRSKLSNSLYYLLEIFQKNKNCLISIGDILKEYSRDGKQMTQDSLRVLISKLRNTIRKDKACPFIIVKEKDCNEFITFK